MSFWGQLTFQEGITSVIELINYFHDYMMVILVLIIAFVSYVFFAVMWTPLVDNNTIESHLLETVWTFIPIGILLFIIYPSMFLLYLLEDSSNPAVSVNVIGHQWYWEYQYSLGFVDKSFDSYMVHSSDRPLFYNLDVDNRLILPASSQLSFLVGSADVIHSFAVPSLGVNADAIPGRVNYQQAFVPFSGVCYGQCSEICGAGHSFMPIVLEFVSASDFVSALLS